jgi:hypothetical protein
MVLSFFENNYINFFSICLNCVLIFFFINQNELNSQNSIQEQKKIIIVNKVQIFLWISIVIYLLLLFLELKL